MVEGFQGLKQPQTCANQNKSHPAAHISQDGTLALGNPYVVSSASYSQPGSKKPSLQPSSSRLLVSRIGWYRVPTPVLQDVGQSRFLLLGTSPIRCPSAVSFGGYLFGDCFCVSETKSSARYVCFCLCFGRRARGGGGVVVHFSPPQAALHRQNRWCRWDSFGKIQLRNQAAGLAGILANQGHRGLLLAKCFSKATSFMCCCRDVQPLPHQTLKSGALQ